MRPKKLIKKPHISVRVESYQETMIKQYAAQSKESESATIRKLIQYGLDETTATMVKVTLDADIYALLRSRAKRARTGVDDYAARILTNYLEVDGKTGLQNFS